MVRREQLFWVFVVYCRLDFKQKFLSLHGVQEVVGSSPIGSTSLAHGRPVQGPP